MCNCDLVFLPELTPVTSQINIHLPSFLRQAKVWRASLTIGVRFAHHYLNLNFRLAIPGVL